MPHCVASLEDSIIDGDPLEPGHEKDEGTETNKQTNKVEIRRVW